MDRKNDLNSYWVIVRFMMRKHKNILMVMMIAILFTANVSAFANSFFITKNAKESSINGNIKTSAADKLNILNPKGSSIWYMNGTFLIQWSWTGAGTSTAVDLFLNRSSTSLFQIISHDYTTASTNIDWWTVPTNITSTASTFQIYVRETYNHTVHAISPSFTIDTTAVLKDCSVNSLVYLGGETPITWNSTVSNVNIDLYKSSTLVLNIATHSTSSTSQNISREYDPYWSVPRTLAGGSDYRIKITAYGNTSLFTYSPYFTVSTAKSIYYVYLSSSYSQVYPTEVTTIYWEDYGVIPNVDIDLYNGGTLVQNIASDIANGYIYMWIVPATLSTTTTYMIRVSDHDNPGSDYNYSNPFTYNSTHAITYVSVDSSMVYLGDTVYIDWSSTPPVKSVDITLYKGSSSVATIASNYANMENYHWYVTGSYSDGSNYRIRITDHDQPSIFKNSSYFAINTSRQITSVSIDSTVQAGNIGHIDWYSCGLITAVDIQLYHSGSFYQYIAQNVPTSSNTHTSYSWLIPQSESTSSNYAIEVFDHAQHSDHAISSTFSITAYHAPLAPWAVSAGENLRWTAGINIVMNFPDEFWQSVDKALSGLGITNVNSKDTYNAFKAAMPNSWNIKANVESLVHDSDSGYDNVIANLLMKENTNNTYTSVGNYSNSFLQKMENALGPVYSLLYPGEGQSITGDPGNNVPISTSEALALPLNISIVPGLVLPTNYSFSDNWNNMITSFENNPSLMGQFGSWSGFESEAGLNASANATGIQASINCLKLNENSQSILTYFKPGSIWSSGIISLETGLGIVSSFLNANLTLTKFTINSSVNYNSSMVLQKLACVALLQGKFTLANGNALDFTMSVEMYVFQGELSSIAYTYHDAPTGLSLMTIILITAIAIAGVAAAVVIVVVVVRKRRV